MSEKSFEDIAREWLTEHPRPRAIICDIDETICTDFDCPIAEAVDCLTKISTDIEVHYVTARPESTREATENFLLEHRLPGWKNVHYCPHWKTTLQHKTEVMQQLAHDFEVIVSIGDYEEDEQASRLAGIHFVKIERDYFAEGWNNVRSYFTS